VVIVEGRPYQYYSEHELREILRSNDKVLDQRTREKNAIPHTWTDYPGIVEHVKLLSKTNHQINLELAARRDERKAQAEAQQTGRATRPCAFCTPRLVLRPK
jgi:hypothetical protein